ETVNNPEDISMGTRHVPFSKTLYIERDDFNENPPKGYFRLIPGGEVRLKHAYFIRHQSAIKDDDTGEIKEIHCTYDPQTRGGDAKDGRKVKGTIHFVSAVQAFDAEVRLYEYLFNTPNPGDEGDGLDFKQKINPDSLTVLKGCKMEPNLAKAEPGSRFQFLRHGYFCVDSVDSKPGAPVFNRIVTLKDSWKKK
ncbi:MAG: glutamine--tRNA ligase, partial [candidate division Zixibacteria bacterium]|nr:glutamine--tRNA ligase [candidate division Zixibacteria bacterium]